MFCRGAHALLALVMAPIAVQVFLPWSGADVVGAAVVAAGAVAVVTLFGYPSGLSPVASHVGLSVTDTPRGPERAQRVLDAARLPDVAANGRGVLTSRSHKRSAGLR